MNESANREQLVDDCSQNLKSDIGHAVHFVAIVTIAMIAGFYLAKLTEITSG